MAMVPDVSRGLKALRTRYQNEADQIAALEEIERIGGLEQMAAGAEARLKAARAAETEGTATVNDLNGQIAAARLVLSKIEDERAAKRQDADRQAADIIAQAHATAVDMVTNTEARADEKIAVAADAAKRIIDTAHEAARTGEAELAAVRKAADDAGTELAKIQGQIDAANNERRRVLKQLGA